MTTAPTQRANAPAVTGWSRELTELAAKWGKEPSTVRSSAPFDADRAHAVAAVCSDAFRTGTQAHAVTRVRFFAGNGRLVVPGELLPRSDDDGAAGYRARLAQQLPGQSWLCTAEQPFTADADAWCQLRDTLAALWQQVGQPALPVNSSLALGCDYRRPPALSAALHESVLIWVLHGELTVHLWRAATSGVPSPDTPPDTTLRGGAGDLLHWPAGYHSSEQLTGEGVLLRVTVPGGASAAEELLLSELMGPRPGERPETAAPERDGMPLLPHHHGGRNDGPDAPVRELGALYATAATLQERLESQDFEADLRTRWALRRSAAGLEPVPLPAVDATLDGDSILEVTGAIVPLDIGERTIWAVNGHPLPLAGSTAHKLHDQLAVGRQFTVAELCARLGAPPGHPQVVALLRTLNRLRAVHTLPDTASAQPHRTPDEDLPEDVAP